jgi:hypothetical protein
MTNDILAKRDYADSWMTDIRLRFPDWNTRKALKRWPNERNRVTVDQVVTAEVIAIATFGTWLDIGAAFPALLFFFNRLDSQDGPPRWDDGPPIGATISVRIQQLSNTGEIWVTQTE